VVDQTTRDVARAAPFAAPARWLRTGGIALLVALYCGLWNLAARLPLNRTDLDAFFLPAARIALSGHPLDVYSVRYMGNYPNANGPLSLAPLTLASAIAAWQGWLSDMELRRVVVMTIFAPFVLLMAREAVAAVDRLRGAPFSGAGRIIAYAVFALSPEIWHSMLFYGHIEQPIMLWLALAGIRQLTGKRPARAGLLLGLALLTRSSAVMLALPLAALLARDRCWRALIRFGATLAGTVGVILLPFMLADGGNVWYSLVSFRGELPIGGGSFWGLTWDTPLASIGLRFDGLSVLLMSLLLTSIVLLRRRDLSLASPALYLLLALSSLCFALLIKTLWPYYFLEPFTFLTIWWLGIIPKPASGFWAWLRWGLALLLPSGVVLCASLREYGLTVEQTLTEYKPGSIVLTIAMTLVMGAILWLLLVRSPGNNNRGATPMREQVAAADG
jgi:hypothetical protein